MMSSRLRRAGGRRRSIAYAAAALLFWIGSVTCQNTSQDGPTTQDAVGPLASNYDIIEAAAQHALDAYTLSVDDGAELLEARKKLDDGSLEVRAAVLFKETASRCYAAFRGANQGFEWVANIDMTISYVKVRNKPNKACRVVRHYKKLYFNKRMRGYKKQLDKILLNCWQNGKVVVFSGHDIGGALANLAAVEFAERSAALWSITFGQPPVFMPAQYVNPEKLRSGPGARMPCRYINLDTFVPFINSIIQGGNFNTGDLMYDFMAYLNVLLYGMIKDKEPLVRADCLVQGAAHTEAFLSDKETNGNLGSQFGRRYLFPENNPDTTIYPRNVSRLDYRTEDPLAIDFENQAIRGVVYTHVADYELRPGDRDCSTPPFVHRMETYLSNIQNVAPDNGDPTHAMGFGDGERCNTQNDCMIWLLFCGDQGHCRLRSSEDRPGKLIPRRNMKRGKNK